MHRVLGFFFTSRRYNLLSVFICLCWSAGIILSTCFCCAHYTSIQPFIENINDAICKPWIPFIFSLIPVVLLFYTKFTFIRCLLYVFFLMKGFSYGFCSSGIFLLYGVAAPAVHFLLLFTTTIFLCIYILFSLSFSASEGTRVREVILLILLDILLCGIQSAYISPFYDNLVSLL